MDIAKLNDEQAFDLLCNVRWGSKTNVCCPKCKTTHQAYFISTRKQWRCKHCRHTFSITSGTLFASHKRPLKDYLIALVLFVNAHKGMPALQLSRYLKSTYRTAFTWFKKFRKAVAKPINYELLSGDIEADGTYFHTFIKPENKKVDRKDQRKKKIKIRINPVFSWCEKNIQRKRKKPIHY